MKKNAPAREVRVQIDSRYEYIELVQRMAEDLCGVARLGRTVAANMGLAVREAVANAIKHGNGLRPGKHVRISFKIEPGRLVVTVRDQGTGFDAERLKDPSEPQNVLRSHGRGIFFMKHFVDELTFRRLKDGGMQVRMEKRASRRRPGRALAAGATLPQGGKA